MRWCTCSVHLVIFLVHTVICSRNMQLPFIIATVTLCTDRLYLLCILEAQRGYHALKLHYVSCLLISISEPQINFSNKSTNQLQHFYEFITWRFVSLNMFRAPPRPSSGDYNCINSLWFYRWSVVVAALLVVVWPPRSKLKPEAVNAVVSSWWWAWRRPKHVERHKTSSNKFVILLHMVG